MLYSESIYDRRPTRLNEPAMRVHFDINMEMPENDERYIHACARIRKISPRRLVARIMKTVCADQLVLAVLDDESVQPETLPGEPRKRNYNG